MQRNKVKILGFCVDSFTMDEAVNYAYSNHGQVVTINPEMISRASSMPDFAKIINEADLVIPDGIGIELGLKILGHQIKRIAGIELGKALIIKFSKENKTIAFIGAKEGVAAIAADNLKSEIPEMNTVYIHDGYFNDDEKILTELGRISPDLILVALGSPKQEFFINKLKSILPYSTMIGLGGSFDVWANKVKRAPALYRKLGLEWLYRAVKDPSRFKRIFSTLPFFVLKVFRERLCGE